MDFLPPVTRKPNGYRIFTDEHLEQLILISIALRSEIVQGGLRKIAIEIIQTSANGDFKKALNATYSYKNHIMEQKA